MAEEYATQADPDCLQAGLREDFRPDLRETLGVFAVQILDRLEAVRIEFVERNEIVETKLLREGRKWAVSFESKFKPTKPW